MSGKKERTEEEIAKFRARGKSARSKGHVAERSIALEFRELGYKDAVTTRASSRMLDACAIDINYVPFNIQSKADKRNFNFKHYCALIDEVNSRILKLPTTEQFRLTYATIVFHKKDRETLVILKKEDLYNILKQIPK